MSVLNLFAIASTSFFAAVVELFPTETALLADVVLPSTAYAEREGTLVNLERLVLAGDEANLREQVVELITSGGGGTAAVVYDD